MIIYNMRFASLILFLAFFYSSSQSTKALIAIDYSHTTHFKMMPSKVTVNAYLSYNNTYSSYEMDYSNTKSQPVEEESLESGESVFSLKSIKNPVIYKDFKKKEIYSIERISLRPFAVKDHFAIFDWTLKDTYKTILGYTCQKAVLIHRGRVYEAFFTTELPFSIGPWKFEGLPGVILEIYSIDAVFKITANRIDVKNSDAEIPLNFNTKEAISWDAYSKAYTKKYNELLSYTDESGGSSSIPKMKIERIVQD
jgi:GLPGLI family protein